MPIDPTRDPRQLARCAACGRTDELSPATLLRHMRDGWPDCCGQPMAHFTDAGTRFARKCSVCGHEWAITFPPGVDVVADGGVTCESCRGKTPAVPLT